MYYFVERFSLTNLNDHANIFVKLKSKKLNQNFILKNPKQINFKKRGESKCMFKFTKTKIFCLVVILSFFIIQIFINQYSIKSEINNPIMELRNLEKVPITEKIETWYIEIPKIYMNANISEGTTNEVLNQYIGHFENTSRQQGNVVLAGCNRGNNVNYFKDLKLIQKGDEIIYKYNEYEKIYEVEKCRVIEYTQVEYLDETEENMLTLITYIENQPQYRRCVQAIEKQ